MDVHGHRASGDKEDDAQSSAFIHEVFIKWQNEGAAVEVQPPCLEND